MGNVKCRKNKREIGLRLKELVKIVENILKGTVNNDIII